MQTSLCQQSTKRGKRSTVHMCGGRDIKHITVLDRLFIESYSGREPLVRTNVSLVNKNCKYMKPQVYCGHE